MELLHSTIRENERRNREVAIATAKYQAQERMIRIAQDFVVKQMTAEIDALVWGIRNGI